ncbi:globin domain-containing protein [Kitasatospora sp. NPDC057015]|uniref:globin domain-containing protein n=1 Tax=Kitasatospora sp. NPDC057015 TaxID=3346001 RepID=UPI003631DFDC
MKSPRALLVRARHGSAAATAVPGLPPLPPAGPAPASDAPTTSGAAGDAGAVAGEAGTETRSAAEPAERAEAEAEPASVPGPPIPARPTVPPSIPAAPRMPPALPGGAPVGSTSVAPLFTDAPGLNWAGPGDSWSRAWAVRTLEGGGPEPAPQAAAQPAADPGAGVVRAADPAEQPPTVHDIELIRDTLAVVEPVADRATAHFYALIFLHHPEVRALFPAAMDVQRDRLFRALLQAARSAHDPAGLTEYLTALGRGHRKYGTLGGHYGPVGECLVAALARYAGSRWDAATELAWRRAYRLISGIMIEAAEGAARTSPPWWQAEVVSHQQRTRDIAVVTVRPDQPYPYRAGQYTTLETPWWPRVWRHFSFASAPRPDGLLTFHVKAVQAGWVSNALVRRAAPGDVLRLGPPAGSMVLDHAAGADLLCLGGGTGIAPVCALVEEVAEHGAAGRSVEVFYGARQEAELYGLEVLRGLAQRHPWLSVHPVLSGSGGMAGPDSALSGELPDVAARFGPWAGREAYVSGPPAMVRRSVGILLRAGVAPGRIRHDLVGDLAAA